MEPPHRALLALSLWLGCLGCSRSGLLVDGQPQAAMRETAAEPPSVVLPCIAVEPSGQVTRLVAARVTPVRADVLFLLDNTKSMAEEFAEISARLRDTLVPAFRARTADTEFGVAIVSDFPVAGHHAPYRLLQPITADVGAVAKALQSNGLEIGGDDPEAQLEGLFQVATGDGLEGAIEPSPRCPSGTHAGVCFRDQSFALVMLFTDAAMRNVAGVLEDGGIGADVAGEDHLSGRPRIAYVRKYDETIAALRAESIRVVGLWSGLYDGLDDLRRVAIDTDALDAEGRPVLFDIGRQAQELGTGTVSALDLARSGKYQRVQLVLADPAPDDGVDTPALVIAVRALTADPSDGARVEAERFEDVQEGTLLTFELLIDTSALPLAADPHARYPITLRVETSDGRLLWEQSFDITAGGDGC